MIKQTSYIIIFWNILMIFRLIKKIIDFNHIIWLIDFLIICIKIFLNKNLVESNN